MFKRELTQAQKEYRKFDNRRSIIVKTLIGFLVAIVMNLAVAFFYVDDDPAPLLLFLGVLIVYTVITAFVCRHLEQKHRALYIAAFGNDTDVIHTGLLGQLWEVLEDESFDDLTGGRVVSECVHNNTIDLQIMRHQHVFDILIDRDTLYMIMDEETDNPVEKEIPLSEMAEVDQVLAAIREFVEGAA